VRRRARQLAAQAAESGDPASWFETLYAEARAAAIHALPALVAEGGTLLVIARATDDQDPLRDPAQMPWPLTRHELESMAGTTLTPRTIEQFLDDENPPKLRWQAEFTRPTA
jgi:hypothetical protein